MRKYRQAQKKATIPDTVSPGYPLILSSRTTNNSSSNSTLMSPHGIDGYERREGTWKQVEILAPRDGYERRDGNAPSNSPSLNSTLVSSREIEAYEQTDGMTVELSATLDVPEIEYYDTNKYRNVPRFT